MAISKRTRAAIDKAAKGAFAPDDAPASARYEITIPDWRPTLLNTLTKRGNYYTAARLKSSDAMTIWVHGFEARVPEAKTRRRVGLNIILGPRVRKADPDAYWKSLLDGMVVARLLIDDTDDWVVTTKPIQSRGERTQTTIIIEDL